MVTGIDYRKSPQSVSCELGHGLWSQIEPLLGDSEKPLVHNHVLAERTVAEKPASDDLFQQMWEVPGEGFKSAVLMMQAGLQRVSVDGEVVGAVVPVGREDGMRRHQACFDGGADALAAFGIGQCRGVADQEDSVIEDLARPALV